MFRLFPCLGEEAIGFFVSRRGCRILAFLDKDLDHVGNRLLVLRIRISVSVLIRFSTGPGVGLADLGAGNHTHSALGILRHSQTGE